MAVTKVAGRGSVVAGVIMEDEREEEEEEEGGVNKQTNKERKHDVASSTSPSK